MYNESWICEDPFVDTIKELWRDLDRPEISTCFRIFFLRLLIPNIGFFYAWLPMEVHSLASSRDKGIRRSLLGFLKDAFALILLAVSIYDIVNVAGSSNARVLEISEPCLRSLSYLLVIVLHLLYRIQGLRVSGFLFRYLFVSCTSFGIDLYLMTESDYLLSKQISPIIHLIFLILSLGTHFWPEPPPRYSEFVRLVGVEGSQNASPDSECSYPSNILFSWMDSLLWSGFKRPLSAKDLWDFIPSVHTALVNPHFLKYWSKTLVGQSSPNILPALFRSNWLLLLKGAFAKLLHDILLITSPLLLQYLILFINSPEQPLWKGIALSLLLLANKILSTLFIARYFFYMVTVGMKLKTSVTSLIYRKSLRIHSTRDDITSGEIVNLMSVDVKKIVDLMPMVNTFWSGPLQILAAIYLLVNTLGYSALAGVTVMILLIPVNGVIAVKMKNAQLKQMEKKDERVKKMNEILQGMKIIKLYAWEPSFLKIISSIRTDEINLLKTSVKYFSLMMLTISSTTFLISLFTFIVYVFSDPENNVLNSEKIFVSISLFNILRFPLNMLTHVIGGIASASVSAKRINSFLGTDELEEGIVSRSNYNDPAISIPQNSVFSWKGSSTPLFKDLSLQIKRGSLSVVVGPVGAGKSSLISALLGEMIMTSKSPLSSPIQINGSVSFTPQNAWMQNASVRDNILFGRKFNKDWYNEVIKASSLEADLEVFPSGDSTEIGEKGINLSGGQKQRISLARAVYSQSDIYLLDDPLAAVDTHVGKHLFEKVICNSGLLSGKTRLLITHNLSYLHLVDEIFVLKDGKILEKGSYDELMDNKLDFSQLISNHSLKQDVSETDSEEAVEAEGMRENMPKLKEGEDKLYSEEVSQTGQVGAKVYWYFLSKIGVPSACLVLVLLTLGQILSTSSFVWLSVWSNAQNNTDIGYYLGIYAGLGFSNILTGFLGVLILSLGILNASRILHDSLLQCMLRNPMSFFDTTPLGRILNRFGQDVEVLDTKMSTCIVGGITGTLSYVATVSIISINVPLFLVPTCIIFVVYYGILAVSLCTSRQLKRLSSVASSPIYSHFGETLAGINTIRAYNLEKCFYSEFERRLDEYQKRNFPVTMADRWLGIRINLIGNLIIFAAALFSVLARDNITSGQLGLNVSSALAITSILSWVIRMYSDMENNIVAAERIKEYSIMENEASWTSEHDSNINSDWPSSGRISIKNISVKYRPELDWVLKNISLEVSSGEKVGIVGRTGSGKSSLALVLFRLLEVSEGEVWIDDQNISSMGLHTLRNKLTIIPQDPVLFSGSLRQNLDPFGTFSDDELFTSLKHAHLGSAFKEEGLDKVIAENGENISVGQRQLICLARALLRKTKILIMDEATAAVDSETDVLIQKTIKENFKEATVLTIAHRLRTILDYSKVLVLDAGRITEFDSPENLLQDSSSSFYGMCSSSGLI